MFDPIDELIGLIPDSAVLISGYTILSIVGVAGFFLWIMALTSHHKRRAAMSPDEREADSAEERREAGIW